MRSARWAALRDVLRLAEVRRLQLGYGLSLIGEFVSTLALFVFAFDAGGATLVAIYGAARTLPGGLVTPVLLALTDRVSADRLLRATTGARALLIGLAAACAAAGVSPGLVIALAAAAGSLTAIFRPVLATMVPWLARTPAELTAANVAATMSENGAALVGPALAGAALAILKPPAAMAIAAGFLGVALLVLWRLQVPRHAQSARRSAARGVLRDVAAGAAALARIARPAGFVVLAFVQTFVRGALLVLLVVIALDVLALGHGSVGWLNAAIGAGGLIGGVLAAWQAHLTRLGRCLVVGLLLWSVPLVVLGAFPSAVVAYLALLVVGAGNAVEDTGMFTLLPRLLGSRDAAPAMGSWLSPTGALIAIGAALAIITLAYAPRFVQIDRATVMPGPEIELLRGLEMFAPLPVATVDQLATVLEPHEYRPGEVVMREGAIGDRFHLILAGRADVTQDGKSLRNLERGDCFGEIALLRDVPRTATVTATEALHTVALSRADFLTAITGNRVSSRAAEELADQRLAATS